MKETKKRYCICRSLDSNGFMIGCDACTDWFHGKCVSITKKSSKNIDKYYCDVCREKNPTLEIKYKALPPPEKKLTTVKQEPLEERKQDKKVLEKNHHQSTSAALKSKPRPAATQPKPSSLTKRKYNQKTKSKSHARKQCANPECVYEARQDSKYCSDECGYAFNKLRYETHFIPKWRILEENHSVARLKKMKALDKLENEKVAVGQLIKNLKMEKEEIEANIRIIKEEATKLAKESENSKEDDDEDDEEDAEETGEIASGDASKTFCITCGHTIPNGQTFRHWSSCHKKHEDVYNFTADVLVNYSHEEDTDPKLYCHQQDKKTKRYCMHLESACPQHSNWQSDKDEVCGCPLDIMQKLVPSQERKYCLELKKDCNQHYHWDKFRLAQMNMQRVQAFTRLDAITDRIRVATMNLDDTYGGVVGVMLHNTINHD